MGDEELLCRVDEQDRVLGSVARGEAHSDPSLIHREVAVILMAEGSRVLMAQRSWKKKVLPGKWDLSCAGHVPFGMGTEAAAHMELEEELGFDVPLRPVGRQLARYDWETHLTHLFVGCYSGQEIQVQESEVEQASLLNASQFAELGDEVNIEFRGLIEAALPGDLESFGVREIDLRAK